MGDIEPDKQYEYRMYVGCGGWLVLSMEAMINLQANIEKQLAGPKISGDIGIITPSSEGGYAGHIPEVPGCITQGETVDECRTMLKDALKCWVEVALDPWISVEESLPKKETEVLVAYFENGHYRCVKAEYVPAKTKEVCFDRDGEFNGETYDSETDTHYWPKGWYECPQNNGGDESMYWQIDFKVTHWMPLPERPGKA